jgi:hypothetical protein
MDIVAETIFGGENDQTEFFKIVLVARAFRKTAINNTDAHIEVVGYVSPNSVAGGQGDAAFDRMVRRCRYVRDGLMTAGVWESAIVGLLPLQPAPVSDDLVVMTVKDTKWLNQCPGMRIVGPGDPAAANNSPTKGQVVVDPYVKPSLAHYQTHLVFDWSTVKNADDDTIKSWFRYYEFGLRKDKSAQNATGDDATVSFNGSDVRYGDVLNQFIAEAKTAGFTFDRDHAWEVTGAILNSLQRLHGTDSGSKLASPTVALQSQLNFTGHRTLVKKDPTNSTDPPTWQVTGQVTVPLHAEGKSGFELTAQGAVSFVMSQDGKIVDGSLKLSNPTGRVTNAQGALQIAWVKSFLDGALQFQGFAQLVGGASWVQDSTNVTSGVVTFKPDRMVQAVGGAQLIYVIPGTGGHVQIFIQVQGSVTGTAGQPDTGDVQGSGGLQIQFNLF